MTVFLTHFAGFQGTQATQFALHADTARVGHFHHFRGHRDIVLVTRRRLHVGHQGTIHHDGCKTALDGTQADRRLGAVILMHGNGNMGVHLGRGNDEMTQERLARVTARAGRSLHDDGTVNGIGGLHDGMHLLHVVDVESGQTVAVLSGMIQ